MTRQLKTIWTLLFMLFLCSPSLAQMARKPTPANQSKNSLSIKHNSDKRFLNEINSQADFDLMARTYHQGTPFALKHAMFVADRKENKIYYVNSQKFRFHQDFLLENYFFTRVEDVFVPVYIKEDRRFIVGTIAWQLAVKKFTWELWEGDLATSTHIAFANTLINKTFFEPVTFKPNSIRQETVSEKLDIQRVSADEIQRNQDYLALNTGKAVGRIHIIEKLDDNVEISEDEILILKELPFNLPPVRGIIVTKPSTPLSHVNILARGWNIPSVYIKNADERYRDLDGKFFSFQASLTNFKFEKIDSEKIVKKLELAQQISAPVNLEIKKISKLSELRKKDSIIYGSKSANLGELINAKILSATVPAGFSIPYFWYNQFLIDNGLDRELDNLLLDNDFLHNSRLRRQKIDAFRNKIQNGKFNEELKNKILEHWKTELGNQAVFVRSSSNAEDLPNFSGAGLYSSVKNVKQPDELIQAVKTVWASLWNFDAYAARARNHIDQTSAKMAVLIQIGIDMEIGGVMVTSDPFDPQNKGAVYISAVWGHSDPITANKFVPEQVLYNPKSNAVQVLTRSQQESVLKFGEESDLVETELKIQRQVLTDQTARELSKIALATKRAFGNKNDLDIEWGIMNGQVYILQARPYIDKQNTSSSF